MFDDYKTKKSVVVVYTGEGKGKTSASLGLMARALGANWKIAYIQYIKSWQVNEHHFINEIRKSGIERFNNFMNSNDTLSYLYTVKPSEWRDINGR